MQMHPCLKPCRTDAAPVPVPVLAPAPVPVPVPARGPAPVCAARRATLAVGALLMALVGSAAAREAVLVAERYELRPLARATVAEDMQRCVGPQTAAEQLHGFVAQALAEEGVDLARATQLTAPQGQGVVVAAAGHWACVPLSSEGFPRWPLETLHGLIVPVGVPADVTNTWRRNLLLQVARDGVGRGLIVYPSGDADQVHIIAEQRQALQIKFSTRLLPAGSYQEQQYAAVLRHPGLKRLVTRSSGAGAGTPWRLAIPPHRLFKPVTDGFVAVEPTALTRDFAFAGTQWDLAGTGGPVTLLANGTVSATQARIDAKTSAQPALAHGSWRVVNGVLHLAMADGARYALTLRDNPYLLSGVGRRAEEAGHEDEGGEWQWPAQLRRLGVPDPQRTQRVQRVQQPRGLPATAAAAGLQA